MPEYLIHVTFKHHQDPTLSKKEIIKRRYKTLDEALKVANNLFSVRRLPNDQIISEYTAEVRRQS